MKDCLRNRDLWCKLSDEEKDYCKRAKEKMKADRSRQRTERDQSQDTKNKNHKVKKNSRQSNIFDINWKNNLLSNLSKVLFFRLAHPSHGDYEKTIGDIEKRFFAFNCQLKNLNREILLSWFDIRFTGYKPEFNFLVGSNLDGPKFFFS